MRSFTIITPVGRYTVRQERDLVESSVFARLDPLRIPGLYRVEGIPGAFVSAQAACAAVRIDAEARESVENLSA